MTENIEGLIKKLGIQKDVIFTGFVSDEQLRQLYNLSELFVFPSFYEGFGFPILEAFCCGTVVITSNTSSCAEIAADAAICVNPGDIKAIADAMERVLTDKFVEGTLRQAGLKRAQEFSFSNMARNTLDVYQKI
jgi:glycosyltransferase involved in cell wall biosynthesis